MAIPTPEERPDLYDDYDGRPEVGEEQSAKEKAYWDGIFSKIAAGHDPPSNSETPCRDRD